MDYKLLQQSNLPSWYSNKASTKAITDVTQAQGTPVTGTTLSQNITDASMMSNHKSPIVCIHGWAAARGNIPPHIFRWKEIHVIRPGKNKQEYKYLNYSQLLFLGVLVASMCS